MVVSTGIVPSPPVYGGAIESHTFLLASALGRAGIKVHYVSDVRKGTALGPNVTVHPVHGPVRKFPVPFPGWIFSHAIGGVLSAGISYEVSLRKEVEVAHFHEETSALLYLRFRPRVPVVFTLHNPPSWLGSVSSKSEALARNAISAVTSRHVVQRSEHFVTFSSSVADGFIRLYGLERERVSVVPHPVDTEFFRPDPGREETARKKYGLQDRYILFLGRLDPRKGISSLLQAVAQLERKPVTVIGGDGPERDSLIELARSLGIGSSTRFLGPVPGPFVPGLLSGADCLVLPSVAEMSPLIIVEALACGLPVVAFDLPGLRGLVADGYTGYLLRPDVSALSSALERIVQDDQARRRLSRNARESALKNHSSDVVVNRLLEIYGRSSRR